MVPADEVMQSSHWGAFRARSEGAGIRVTPIAADPAPSPLLGNLASAVHHPSRVARPAIRRGWLEGGPGPGERGLDEFVEVTATEAVDLLAEELRRVYADHGPTAVYGGSYGWGSAGRFHHAPGQLHRFLNALGGYVRGVNTYSYGASEVILPHVLGQDVAMDDLASPWSVIAQETDLILSFGGMPLKNAATAHSGVSRHTVRGHVDAFLRRGGDLVQIGPYRHELPGSRWIPIEPGTDVAVMLGMLHTLVAEGRVDVDVTTTLCIGFAELADYVLHGREGGSFDAAWAARVSGADAEVLRQTARDAAASRSLINVAWALQRAPHGEQVPWMAIALAAATGGLGLPGQGFAHGHASSAGPGSDRRGYRVPTLPTGTNPVNTFIPVAQIADLLLRPGGVLDYDGQRLVLPDIRLVYWAGGNPFHHHQDLRRLRRAFARPDTVVVHDSFWTALALHADIVLPASMTVERNDIGAARSDATLIAMKQAVPPWQGARDDYAWFSDLAQALGVGEAFTEGRDERAWLMALYDRWRDSDPRIAAQTPDFETFWAAEAITLETVLRPTRLEAFRADPVGRALHTPSGRVELVSDTVGDFGDPEVPSHPVWRAPDSLDPRRRAEHPLCLLADQPATKLHSQLDVGEHSQSAKVNGRESIELHPLDAADRGIAEGDVVQVTSAQGACWAVATLRSGLIRGLARMPTGTWYTPVDLTAGDERCLNGNPNVLTRDRGTSSLGQGCTGSRVLVEVRRDPDAPEARLPSAPRLVPRNA